MGWRNLVDNDISWTLFFKMCFMSTFWFPFFSHSKVSTKFQICLAPLCKTWWGRNNRRLLQLFRIQEYKLGNQILTNYDEVCIPCLSSILLAVLSLSTSYLVYQYRISSYSFRGKYSFLTLALCTVTFDHST